MNPTKELHPFEQNKTFKDLGFPTSIFSEHENYVYYTKAETEEEKAIAVKGCIWHCISLIKARDIKKWRYEHFIMPGERFNDLCAKLNEKYPNKTWVKKRRNERLDHYDVKTTVWDKSFVFRVFKLHINITKGNETLYFNEYERIIIKDKDIYIESKNNITKVGLGIFINRKNHLPYYNIISTTVDEHNKMIEQVFNKETQNQMRIMPTVKSRNTRYYLSDQTTVYCHAGISIQIFFWIYGKIRQNTITSKKEIPEFIKNELKAPETTLSNGVQVKNNDNFMALTYIYNGFELEKIFFCKNKTYIFDRNPYDNEWSISRKNLTIYKLPFSEYFTDDNKDIRKVKKIFNDGIKKHTSGRCIPRCNKTDRPLVQYFSAKKSVAAEQALKYGFYNVSNIADKNNNLNVFACSDAKNISEFFGIPGKWLNLIHKEISYQGLKNTLNVIEQYKQEDTLQNIDVRDLISIGFDSYDIYMLKTINKTYRENGKDFGKSLHKIVKENPKNVYSILDSLYDYKEQRNDALRYIENHNIDCKLPPVFKLSHLKYYHDKATIFSRNYRRELYWLKNKELEENVKKYINSDYYQERLYNDDKYTIITPQTSMEIEDEGAALSHCVGSYITRVAKEKCEIYFLRKTDDIKKPFLTIEVRDDMLVQCYGYADHCNSDENAAEFIKQWCEKKDLDIRCIIYRKTGQ